MQRRSGAATWSATPHTTLFTIQRISGVTCGAYISSVNFFNITCASRSWCCSALRNGRRRRLAARCSLRRYQRIFPICIWSTSSAPTFNKSGIRTYFTYPSFAAHGCKRILWTFCRHFSCGVVSVCAYAGLCAGHLFKSLTAVRYQHRRSAPSYARLHAHPPSRQPLFPPPPAESHASPPPCPSLQPSPAQPSPAPPCPA